MSTVALTLGLVNHPLFATLLQRLVAWAKTKMPAAAGRLDRAAAIVLAGGVTPSLLVQDAWHVASQRHPDGGYEVADNACTCEDYVKRKPTDPDLVCKHILAAWLYQRVEQRLTELKAAEPEPEYTPLPTDGCWQATDQDGTPCHAVAETCTHQAAAQTPALPEAPASVNVRITLHGREVQWTLRDSDEARLLERLEALLQRFPVEQAPVLASSTAPSTPAEGWCPKHQVQMKRNTKEGRSWWSHKAADGTWCKGK